MPLPPDSAPTLAFGVCDDHWTGRPGLGVVARLARFLELPEKLAASVRLQRRRRGSSDGQMLLALIYSACVGGGHLHAVDADRAAAGVAAGRQRVLLRSAGGLLPAAGAGGAGVRGDPARRGRGAAAAGAGGTGAARLDKRKMRW